MNFFHMEKMGIDYDAILIFGAEISLNISTLLKIKENDPDYIPKLPNFDNVILDATKQLLEENNLQTVTNNDLVEFFENEFLDDWSIRKYDLIEEINEWLKSKFNQFSIKNPSPYYDCSEDEKPNYLDYKLGETPIEFENLKNFVDNANIDLYSKVYEILTGTLFVKPRLMVLPNIW